MQSSYSGSYAYLNGEILPGDQAKISIFDSGFYFGFGIYETMLMRDRVPVFYEEHLERMASGAGLIHLPGFDGFRRSLPEKIKKLTAHARSTSPGRPDYRLRIFLSPGEVGLPVEFKRLTELITLTEIKTRPQSTRLALSGYRKTTQEPVPSFAKLTAKHRNLMAAREAAARGAAEGLMINYDGYLTEGSFSNFFFIKEGKVFTPALKNNLLAGCTRTAILEVLEKLKIPYETGSYRYEEVEYADEAFISASTRGIVPVSEILNPVYEQLPAARSFDRHDLTQEIMRAYERRVTDYIAAHTASWTA